MKPILKLIGLSVILIIQTTIYAQSLSQKRVLVYFKTGVQRNPPPNQNTVTITSSNVTQLLSSYGLNATNVSSSFPDFNEADTVIAEMGEDSRQMNWAKVFSISLPDTSFKSALINSLNNLSEALYAEPDGDARADVIPADGRFGSQWNLKNTLVVGGDIHAEAAWNIFTGNPNSIIAIIDDGVDVNHNDLAAKISGGDNSFLISTDPNTGQQFSHGSLVAGIAAAVTNNTNNNGVAGVDWQAKIHPRYAIGNNSGDPGIAKAIQSALNFSPNVWTFNHSWDLPNANLSPGRYSTTVRAAFANIYRNNRVSCAAMGNTEVLFPGITNFPAGFNSGIIAVGSTNIFDVIEGTSSKGPHIDVSAPGVEITSTNFNNGYVAFSGTSMATPHVSGLASLLKGFNTNLANDDIEQIIRLTADDKGPTGFDNTYGAGRINADKALHALLTPNTLQQLNTTGGTIFSTSGNMTRVFLGFPRLVDGIYTVQRSEVRTNVTFPTAMCSTIGVWGRGVGTTGYREELNRCFGEGICEVVPGTLTSTGATLRTWIYQVWNSLGQNLGFYPKAAANVVFQYTILGVPFPTMSISGDNTVCTTSNNYIVNNLPAGATVQWQATPTGIVIINSPTAQQTTLTKNSAGAITLTSVISNVCGGQVTVSKQNIRVGGFGSGDYPVSGPSSTNCGSYVTYTTNQLAGATNYTWFYPGSWSYVSGQGTYMLTLIANGNTGYYQVGVRVANACDAGGSYAIANTFLNCGYMMFTLSPNPATSTVTISTTQSKATQTNSQTKIYQVKILDQFGTVQKQYSYSGGITSTTISLSGLVAGIYLVQAFNGSAWSGQQVIKQ